MTQNIPSTLSVSDARNNLYNLVKQASDNLRQFTITHKGKPKAVLLSTEELESWQETMDILNDPLTMKDLRLSQKQAKQGKTISFEKVIKQMGIKIWTSSLLIFLKNNSKNYHQTKLKKSPKK